MRNAVKKAPRRRRPPSDWNDNPTFSQWLFAQQSKRTKIGEFARWVYADAHEHANGYIEPCWPHRSNTLSHLVLHLKTAHASDDKAPEEVELRRVFAEYHAFMQRGEGLPHRRGGVLKNESNEHRGYLIAKTTIAQIRELATWAGTTQGEVIERTIAKEYERQAAR